MLQQGNKRKQSNQYDKVIKENLGTTLPVIIREIFGLNIIKSEELPEGLQHTKERKPDALKKVTDSAGNNYVLQVEFQVNDEKDMVYRMAEYSVMLMRKYQLPIKQYVIFLKDNKPSMATFLDTEHLKFDYTLIRIAEMNYKLFLKSNNPEVKMLGILANFGRESSYKVTKSIIEEMRSSTNGDLARNKYFNQLRILVQLRSHIEPQFEKAMFNVSDFFKEENDIFYRRGQANGEARGEARGELKGKKKGKAEGKIEGEQKKSKVVVKNLIKELGIPDEQIARITEVPLDFVVQLRLKSSKK